LELEDIGWNEWFGARFVQYMERGWAPARVTLAGAGRVSTIGAGGALEAQVPGRLRHLAATGAALPVAGDWVVLSPGSGLPLVEAVIERRTAISRKVTLARTDEQVLAANVDIVFLVASVAAVNLRRLERQLTMAWESGARPIVVLTKADLVPNADVARSQAAAALGVDAVLVSSIAGTGIEEIRRYLGRGTTAVLLGPSGVGKSTLVNALSGEEILRTNEIRSDGKGRHTTSHRELIRLPSTAMIIDTPGLRELQLWNAGEGLERTFADIEELAARCKFSDCRHDGEPGCAVAAAVAGGELAPERLASHHKLQRELRVLALREDDLARIKERNKWKTIHKEARLKSQLKGWR
jgi:ribosome biogenesis GTPase